jgi:osmotically-inducible protein OsmY
MIITAAVAGLLVSGAQLRASEADDAIESSFKQTYNYKMHLLEDDFKAEASEGVVTLTGTVADETHSSLAQETAASLPGVTSVENQLKTKLESEAPGADAWIGRKVKLSLLFHRNVNARKTEVEVKDGVVTLKGEASSEAQKELTGEYANDIEGVKEVRNEMTVVAISEPPERSASEKMDDASITAQVKTALSTHRSTSAIKIGALTLDGHVTLTGIAKNEAEKAMVTKLVSDILGVTGVKNQMTLM